MRDKEPAIPTAPSRWLVALALFVNSAALLPSPTGPGFFAQKRGVAARHLESLVADWRQVTGVPGTVVVVVDGHRTLFAGGFGDAIPGSAQPADATLTVFPVGELVQPLTAASLLQLAERGALDLDRDIAAYLSPGHFVSAYQQPVTARQLLTHTAGLDDWLVATRVRHPAERLPLPVYLDSRSPPLVRPPGLVSVPSEHGYALAGHLVEELSGESFSTYLRRNLLDPLGMSRTAAGSPTSPPGVSARGHRWQAGRLSSVTPDYPHATPASALTTTGADMARWMILLLAGEDRVWSPVLGPDSVRQLLEPQFADDVGMPARTLAFGQGQRYSPPELFQASIGNGFSAVMVLLPRQRLGLFAAFNCEVDFWGLVYAILDRLEPPGPLAESPASVSTRPPSGLTGYWRHAQASHSTAEKLLTLVRQDRTRVAGNGLLHWRSRAYRAIESRLFQQVAGPDRIRFLPAAGPPRYAVTPGMVLERLRWYEAQPFQAALWLFFSALFLADCRSRTRLPRRVPGLEPDDAFAPRWPLAIARVAAVFHLLFIVATSALLTVTLMQGPELLVYGAPGLVYAVLSLPLIAATLTAVALAGLARVWRHRRWTRPLRLRLTRQVVTLLAFLPVLHFWNLLGFRL